MRNTLLATLALVGILAGATVAAQSGDLSAQVLRLLTRNNTWSGEQKFKAGVKSAVLERTGISLESPLCTDAFENRGGALYFNCSLVDFAEAGAGTVTSVTLTVPSILSVSGSPITSSGTFAVSLATQSANTIFSGPTSGGAATPTFRAIVDNDIPNTITIAGTDNVTWASVNKSGSSLADLATRSAGDLTGSLALANLTDGGTAGVPLVAGGGGGDPSYTALNLADSNVTSGLLHATRFPALAGDVTSAGGTLTTALANTAVTPGSYTAANITVDAKGRITNAANGSVSSAAHNILSSTHSDTLAAALVEGDILLVNSTPALQRLAIGSEGMVLRSDGTTAEWSFDGSLLTDLNASALTSGEVDDGILSANVPLLDAVNAWTGAGIHSITGAVAGIHGLRVRNTNSSATSYTLVSVGNNTDADTGQLITFSSGFTTSGFSIADGTLLKNTRAGGLTLTASNAAGVINFYTGGSNLRATINAAGLFNNKGGETVGEATATITANQNNYAIADSAGVLMLGNDGAYDITGIAQVAATGGRRVIVCNTGANDLTLEHEDTNSTEGNRFRFPDGNPLVLSTSECTELIYSLTQTRWYRAAFDTFSP